MWNVRVEIYSLSKLWLPLSNFHKIHAYSTKYEKILHKEFHENTTKDLVVVILRCTQMENGRMQVVVTVGFLIFT
jgi:hypothetical protein